MLFHCLLRSIHSGTSTSINRSFEESDKMKNLFVRFVREEEGQDLIEYSLLAALIAVASIVAMKALSTEINSIFTKVGSALAAA